MKYPPLHAYTSFIIIAFDEQKVCSIPRGMKTSLFATTNDAIKSKKLTKI